MPFDLIEEALLASGVKGDKRVALYIRKLDRLCQEFIGEVKTTDDLLPTARALFDWLWTKKPERFRLHGSFRLDNAIDSQLNKDSQVVGNCLGLTLLYNCLLRRVGISAGALYLGNAFAVGPHVITFLEVGASMIDVENILPNGFDYRGHLGDPSRTRWGDKELIADIYHSQGNEWYEKGEYDTALANYDMALRLNHGYEKAHLNKAIVLDKLRMEKETS